MVIIDIQCLVLSNISISLNSVFEGVESAHSGEALLPDVGYNSSSGAGPSRSTPRQKKNRRGESTPLIRGAGRNRNRSDYEDLDVEAFNNWPSKYSF